MIALIEGALNRINKKLNELPNQKKKREFNFIVAKSNALLTFILTTNHQLFEGN